VDTKFEGPQIIFYNEASCVSAATATLSLASSTTSGLGLLSRAELLLRIQAQRKVVRGEAKGTGQKNDAKNVLTDLIEEQSRRVAKATGFVGHEDTVERE
tara:strand:- start:489 stop:788 length:300 start_codon:yes stop_codon:yes gene_type:complete